MGKEELERLRGQVLQALREKLNMEKCLLLLYGSTALREDTELSDIDLALDCLEPLTTGYFLSLWRS